MIKPPPRIIAIEGIDGSGKGTQATLLRDTLRAIGHDSNVISFPDYTTPYGKEIAKYLNGGFGSLETAPVLPISLLYALNRVERRDDIHHLKNAGTVIFDRYMGSNLAHQGARLPPEQRDAFFDMMEYTEYENLYLPRPDVTIFLDVDEEVSKSNVAKKAKRGYTNATHDLHESSDAYLAEVKNVYRQLADKYGWRRVNCAPGGVMRPTDEIGYEVFARIFL